MSEETLADVDLSKLQLSPSIADELEALAAIYESPDLLSRQTKDSKSIHLRLDTLLPDTEVPLSLSLSIPPTYPEQDPPSIALESKYLGPFLVDAQLLSCVSIATFEVLLAVVALS